MALQALQRLSWAFGIYLFFCSSQANARVWELKTSSTQLQAFATEVRKEMPEVKTSADLAKLLEELTESNSLAFLTATLESESGKILLEAEVAAVIRGIAVKTLTRAVRFDVELKVGKYIGQTDSAELRKQIQDEILLDLKNKGFYQSRLKFEPVTDEGGLAYSLYVDEGLPCLVARVETNFKLPSRVDTPFKVGMDCNISEIRTLLSELETELVNAGYNLQRIQTPELIFDDKSNTATLKVEGSLGKKIRYRVLSPSKTPGVLSIVFGDSLNKIDQSITDPDAMGSELARKYQSQGYDDVEVSRPKAVNLDEETIEYQFTVDPGPEYHIVDVQFEGLVSLTPDEASESIDLKTTIGNAPLFSQDLVVSSRDRLKNIFLSMGFWDAQVFEPRITKNPATGEVKLVFVVREGKKRVFQELVIAGNRAVSSDRIEDTFPLDTGDDFNRQVLLDFDKQVKAVYRQRGYLHVDVGVELQQNLALRDIETKVVLQINENQKSRFGEVFIKGLIKTDPVVIQREMRFKTGDDYNPDLVEESRQALADLGLFSSISMVPSETVGQDSVISYSILVRESRSGTISFGPGWSREEGLRFSVESSYNNIGGTGRKVFSKGTLNEERDQTPLGGKSLLGRYAGVGYLEPWLFDLPIDGTLAFNYRAEARDTLWEISRSAEAIISHRVRRLKPKTFIEAFTLYKESREEAEESVKDAALIDSGKLQIREVGLRHITDGRNNLAWPTRGYRLTTDLSTAGFVFGGGLKYVKWSLGYNIYREIYTDFVFAAGVTYTKYVNVQRRDGSDVLPPSERLTAGGAETNRGFRDNTLGPVFVNAAGEQIYDGGSQRSSERVELRYQIINETLALTTFLDSSNSAFSGSEEKRIREEHAILASEGQEALFADNEPYAFEKIFTTPSYMWTKNYVSYGVAGNYLTPLGSVNLSFGWPWRRCLNNRTSCDYPRGNSNYRNLLGAVVSLNIGANF
ncbi:MAG: hypothetical protein EOP10_19200 [Proteobacteria bacterium]|nr:MAG: hypothetical protein EOP10_19200 [Pseudomonadota bacterium]